MARKRYKPEEVVAKLRQVDVSVSQGQGDGGDPADRCERGYLLSLASGVWRLKIAQVTRLKELHLENSRLRKAISDLTLDKLIL